MTSQRLVVAVDFGTTYSGYAYCWQDEYDKNITNPKILCNTWIGGKVIGEKAPTCVLFNSDKKFHSFGYDAVAFYEQNAHKENFRDWYYFEHFKMKLYNETDLTTETYLEEFIEYDSIERVKKMKAVDVFAAVIRFFKERLMDDIKKSRGQNFTESKIQWVLTVPAIWDLAARHFMRTAAHEAGIPHEQLLLALEPEAASIFCRRVPVGVETLGDGRKIIAAMGKGDQYIVLDQGGGTTDIAVHEVTGLHTLKEINPPCGGHWGGITVNKKFYEFLIQIFGKDVINSIQTNTPSVFFEFLHVFEHTKTSFQREHEEEGKQGKITLRVPVEWTETFKRMNDCDLSASIKKSEFHGLVSINKDKMRIKSNEFRKFYDFSIENVTAELQSLLQKKELSKVKTLLIVGGHSASTVFTGAIKDKFPNLGTVVPKDPGLAVLKGAVLFGFAPESITERVARFTFGISTTRNFKKGDPESKKIQVDGIDKCQNVFDKHIDRGQILKVGENEYLDEHEYVPLYKDQTSVDFKFYQTLNKNPQYVTDDGCHCIGSLHFKLTDGMTGKKEMKLKINASGTELVALVTETATGKKGKGYFRLPK